MQIHIVRGAVFGGLRPEAYYNMQFATAPAGVSNAPRHRALQGSAPTRACSHIPFSRHFVSNEWLSLSATGDWTDSALSASIYLLPDVLPSPTPPPPGVAPVTRPQPAADLLFPHPMLRILPTAWSFLASTRSRRTTYYLRHNPLLHTRLSPPGLVAR